MRVSLGATKLLGGEDDLVLERRAEVLGELVSLDRAMYHQRFAWVGCRGFLSN